MCVAICVNGSVPSSLPTIDILYTAWITGSLRKVAGLVLGQLPLRRRWTLIHLAITQVVENGCIIKFQLRQFWLQGNFDLTNKPRGVQPVFFSLIVRLTLNLATTKWNTLYTEKGLNGISSSHNNAALSFPWNVLSLTTQNILKGFSFMVMNGLQHREALSPSWLSHNLNRLQRLDWVKEIPLNGGLVSFNCIE